MSTFYSIQSEEMNEFLTERGFKQMPLSGVAEHVYGRRYGKALCVRVYTTIQDGQAREVGSDAIRVTLFWRSPDGTVFKVGGSKRVHRIKTWAKNLQNRIEAMEVSMNPTPCPCCGAPMALRKVKNKKSPSYGKEFLSCVTWSTTKCSGSSWSETDIAKTYTIRPTTNH